LLSSDSWCPIDRRSSSTNPGSLRQSLSSTAIDYTFTATASSGELKKPKAKSAAGIAHLGLDYPALTNTRRSDAPGDLTYIVYISEDLVTWHPRPFCPGLTNLTLVTDTLDNGDGTHTVQVRYNTDIASLPGEKLFFKITATE
jgi:hypothetical protein